MCYDWIDAHDLDAELDVARDLGPAGGLAVEMLGDRGDGGGAGNKLESAAVDLAARRARGPAAVAALDCGGTPSPRGSRLVAAVVADLVVAELVVAALHEVARQAGADARLEVVAARAELLDVGRVAQVHDTRR